MKTHGKLQFIKIKCANTAEIGKSPSKFEVNKSKGKKTLFSGEKREKGF